MFENVFSAIFFLGIPVGIFIWLAIILDYPLLFILAGLFFVFMVKGIITGIKES